MVKIVLAALTLVSLRASGAPPPDWNVVAKLAPGTRVHVYSMDRSTSDVRGTVVTVSAESLVVKSKAGETSIQRSGVKRVKVAAPHRRTRNGLMGLAIGAGAGLAAGWAVCVYCANEGHSGYWPHGLGAGSVLGALAFLPMPYVTIYQAPRK